MEEAVEIRNNFIHLTKEDTERGLVFPLEIIENYAIVPCSKFFDLLEKADMTWDEFVEWKP